MSLLHLSCEMTGPTMVMRLPGGFACTMWGLQAVCEQVDVMLGAAASSSGRHSYHGSSRSYHGSPRSSTS